MKKGWILGLGALLALGSFAALPHGEASIAYAAEGDITPVEDADLQKYFIAGTGFMVGDAPASWGDTPLYPTKAYNKELGGGTQQLWYEVEVLLPAGAQFKLVARENQWCSPGLGGYADWFEIVGNDQNCQVKQEGLYTLSWVDGVEGYGDASYGWNAERAEPEGERFDVIYWDGDKEVVRLEDAVIEGQNYQPTFQFYEGHTLEGLYSDPECQEPITGSVLVQGDVNVYGVWGTAGPDLSVYFQGNFTHAYAYRSVDGINNATWPGVSMADYVVGAFASDVTMVVLPAEYEFDRIIFNGGDAGGQTADLEITADNYIDVTQTNADYRFWGSDAGWMDETASADRYAALDAVALWRTQVRVDGSICWLENNAEAWEMVKEQVAGLSEAAYALVYDAEDIEGVTIGQSYDYLVQLIDGTVPGGEAFGLYPAGTSQEDIALYLALGSLGLLVLGAGAYLLYRRKRNRA